MSARRLLSLPLLASLWAIATAAPAQAAECELTPRTECFGLESVEASLSTTQAGAHPDLTFSFEVKQDPESPPNVFGLHESFAPVRNVSFDLPPGLIGDPNVLGKGQLCTVAELISGRTTSEGAGCPNGSQIGTAFVSLYSLPVAFNTPVYMMQPPGGDVVARAGLAPGALIAFVDFKLRSEGDYGLTAEISDTPPTGGFVRVDTTTWGVPSDPVHDTERCTIYESFQGCVKSPPRPPGSSPLPFLTNPTRCGVPLGMSVSVASWVDPERFDTLSTPFPQIAGCNKLPFGPAVTVTPTTRRAAAPSGTTIVLSQPGADGVDVLEPSQVRDIRIQLPEGLAINPAAGDGLETCSATQVRLATREPSACPHGAKLADTVFDIPVLERDLKGAVYLREPEPGRPFRIWSPPMTSACT